MYIIFALLAFSALILVHELGHFIVAKLNGIYVEEFAIGMGPKLFGVKVGETEYNLRILPFGGFVKMLGEEDESDDSRSLNAKTPIQRILVMGAGAFMNYVLALIIFIGLAMSSGFAENKVASVVPNSPAQEIGIEQGDEFLKIDGNKIHTTDDFRMGLALAKGNPVELEIKRGNDVLTKTVQPILNESGMYQVGIGYGFVEKPTLLQGIKQGFNETRSLVSQSFIALKTIVTGEANLKTDVGGPVTIIKMSGQAAKAGANTLLWFMAFLSVQLAVFNLLPFPALDGGRIFIELIQMIIRKEIPAKYIEAVNTVGFMLLMGLMVLVTIKDIIFPIL
ncbi:RIP metalloprotease RseP [Clostridium perfringens]|uniref:RIP metalloprotease RseP n=1 Tax=Clostridium perfringens TaxID=1502 RepID=UPI00232A8DDB|nr:RIP metalloprotease RseP [Clostridium perfringens]MDB2044665.1 RIP metalloprotease RseP [Clostridium perfringens]MDB2056725.1 RIP metalloprotease RseP [Clostridium perfringens]